MSDDLDELQVRARNLERVRALGVRVNASLPHVGGTTPRSLPEVIRRSLVVLAFLQLSYGAPMEAIRSWIAANGLQDALSANERRLLGKEDAEMTKQEKIDLSWSVETLYGFMWIGGLVEGLSPEGPIPELVDLSPDIEFGEDGSKYADRMRRRPYGELYAMLDLFYLAHWSARDARLAGDHDGPLDEGVVMERRKALEWALDDEMDWDDVDQNT